MAFYDPLVNSIAGYLGIGRSTTPAYSLSAGRPSRSGKTIEPETVVQNDTVFACVNLISDTIAQTEVYVVDTRSNAGVPLLNHAVTQLLWRPNSIQTTYEFIHGILWDILTYGNAYVLVNGEGAGRELVILEPRNMTIASNEIGRPLYRYRPNGSSVDLTYTQDQIIHFRDIATSSIEGRSRVLSCADLVGQSIALDDAVSDILRNAANVSGILKTEQSINVDKKKEIADSWRMAYGPEGTSNGATAILDAGLSYQQVQFLTIADADAINLKSQLINRCAAIFRVPAQYLEQSDSNKYNNVSQKKNSFFSDTLSPIIVNIEQKLTQRLLQRVDRNLEVRFDRTSLIKGDLVSQIGVAAQAVSNGIWTANEAREFLGGEPMEQEGASELRISDNPSQPRTDMPGAENGLGREMNNNG